MGKPQVTLMTDEDLLIHPEMVDTDQDKPPFLEGACLTEGCSGYKKIDTMYENTSQDSVENPKEGSTPSPICLNSGMYPHRRL